MAETVAEIVVVGAGVVGMAVAAELASRGRDVLVLEAGERPGTQTTSRSSQVIHAGLHGEAGSLKARLCVEGRELLYRRCERMGVPHRRVGKLVVATCREEEDRLAAIEVRARANGAPVTWLAGGRVQEREPTIQASAALWSPESGIIDAHALTGSYRSECEAAGGRLALRTRVTGLARRGGRWRIRTQDATGAPFDCEAELVVNSTGLFADALAISAGIDVEALGWRTRFCKGEYFAVRPGCGALTRHLVYPVPSDGGLGVHVTMDLAGRYRLGPDAQWVDRIDYGVDPSHAARFAEAVGRYLPGLTAADLVPDQAGIRPKLSGPGEPAADFVVEECSSHGAPGFVHLAGIESPGLTASGALARYVADLL